MAIAATPEQNSVSERGHWRLLAGFLGAAVVVLVAFALAVLLLSGATLSRDPTALARVSVQLFGGKVRHVSAYSPSGHEIPISVHDGRLTPLVRLTPGEQVSIEPPVVTLHFSLPSGLNA